MHRSRLGVILFDHPADSFEAATTFWGRALGNEVTPEVDNEFTEVGRAGGFEVATQRLGEGAPRVHPDIETDDIDAEVERLVGLGASISSRTEGCVILTDPGGIVFCVVGVQSPEEFEKYAISWP